MILPIKAVLKLGVSFTIRSFSRGRICQNVDTVMSGLLFLNTSYRTVFLRILYRIIIDKATMYEERWTLTHYVLFVGAVNGVDVGAV